MPEEIQRRGFLKAGRLWCAGYWEAGGDLCEMQVKRVLGERRYRFFVWDTLPKNMFRVVSRHYPTLKFCLTALIKDDNSVLWDNELTLREYMIANGQYMGSYRRNETDAFAQIKEKGWVFSHDLLECCQTVREHGLRMIRPREHTPGLCDIREPFEAGPAGSGWTRPLRMSSARSSTPSRGPARDIQDPAGIRDPEILLEGRKWHIAFI